MRLGEFDNIKLNCFKNSEMELEGIDNENFQSSKVDINKFEINNTKVASKESVNYDISNEEHQMPPPTSYLETLMHLFKGNVGTGCFAMADAVKNGGLILGPILTLLLGTICVSVQHTLLKCSSKMKIKHKMKTKPDYAETVELCFLSSGNERWRKLAPTMKTICNVFICITQLGFCCIYFLFIGSNLKQVLDFYGFNFSVHLLATIALIPIWLSALITNLKYLAPCSGIANICMITGIVITYYYAARDLPPITERNSMPTSLHSLPLFFGTVIFALEGIALVLPLQNSMKKPHNFSKKLGVLNVGMVFVTGIFISFGAIGYWQYGDNTRDTLTLNLPTNEILAQSVKLVIVVGVVLGYAIQFFVAIQIMFPRIKSSFKFVKDHPLFGELLFRTFMVLITFVVAELVPNLGLLLSLIGSVCSTVLALVLPPLMEFILLSDGENELSWFVIFRNSMILVISLIGFLTGGYVSVSEIIKENFV